MAIAEIAAGAAGLVGNLFNSIYNIQANQRDFNYQSHLQQEIFDREDNAIQRRMEDLKAAGLNPNLAAGSAAGAGSVVGRSNTPSLSGNPVGTALDAASHVQQIRAQETENKILRNQEIKSRYESKMAKSNARYIDLQNTFDEVALLYQLGLTSDTYLKAKDGKFSIHTTGFDDGDYEISNTPLQNQLEWQWRNNKNAADLLQKDVDWYTADKIADMIGAGARAAGNIGSAYYNFNRRR